MQDINVYNLKKEKVNNFSIDDGFMSEKPNISLMHEAVINQLSNIRKGCASTKNVAKVTGSNKKPWRQKGTGRARVGSNKSPLWVGGGVIFGPQPRDYKSKMNKKKIKSAIKSAIKAKLDDDAFVLVDKLSIESGKTKDANNILLNIAGDRKVLMIIDDNIDKNTIKAVRNLEYVKLLPLSSINVYDLINAKHIVIESESFEKLIKRYIYG
ncbi:MAG: 50S ribosomal protein L4 [Deferribacterota bacterium]|nr:50S ribosomal protein L4 [Deferribacterota bacterium]